VLCRRAAQVKGADAVGAICARHGVKRFGRRLDELNPQQERELRAAVEELLNNGGAS
jgi:hypothetical protein